MPNFDPRILEALEACRPQSDDVADPAMKELAGEIAASRELDDLYERSQRLDAALQAAFRDVPVPGALQDRILARLAAQSQAAPKFPASLSPARPRSSSRRWWLMSSATAAAILVVSLVGLKFFPPRTDMNAGRLVEEAIQFYEDERSHDAGKLLVPGSRAWAEYSTALVSPGAVKVTYRELPTFLGLEGFESRPAAYDIELAVAGNGTVKATLYVVDLPADLRRLPTAPPATPGFNTSGCAAAAWQENDHLYVLVVEGRPEQYQQIVSPAADGVTV